MRIKIILVTLFFLKNLQAEDMMEQMALMIGAQMAGSVANQVVTQEFEDMAHALNKSQTDITQAMNNFDGQVQAAQKKSIKNSYYFFQKAQKNINQLLEAQQQNFQEMLNYLQSSVSIAPALTQYLQNPVQYDQDFAHATMLTPKGLIWKNVYPVGNWEYDQNTDSFWQMSLMPLLVANNAGVMSADKAINNSIFTEWITRKDSYEIECEFILYKVSYPFFIGLMFNKARWISGDLSCLQKYRLLGIYAKSATDISINFTEAKQEINGQSKVDNLSWIFPFEQIVKKLGSASKSISNSFVKNIASKPIVFRLKVLTSATRIQYKFWQLPDAQPATYTTIASQNYNLYLYHGLGFMAPGCIAQCSLLAPKEALFTQQAQDQFKGSVNAMISKKLIEQNTKSVDAIIKNVNGG